MFDYHLPSTFAEHQTDSSCVYYCPFKQIRPPEPFDSYDSYDPIKNPRPRCILLNKNLVLFPGYMALTYKAC